jgi:hypothetical protein
MAEKWRLIDGSHEGPGPGWWGWVLGFVVVGLFSIVMYGVIVVLPAP